jgi:rhodanese-related sulfurtransferase
LKASSILSNKYIQFLISLVLVTFMATTPVAAQAQVALLFGDLTWLRINTYLDKEYPEVASVSTKELAAQSGVTLLDTRTVEEFNASHLPGAKHYDSAKVFVGTLTKNTPIVVYCSVGVRSASIAKKLQADGYTNVLCGRMRREHLRGPQLRRCTLSTLAGGRCSTQMCA